MLLLAPLILASVSLPAVRDLQGGRHELLPPGGEPLAVVFLNHDCPVCNSYAPELDRIARTYQGRVRFAFVYPEPGLTPEVAKHHAAAFDLPILQQYLDSTSSFAKACGATIVPEAAVFDSTGRRTYLGRIDDLYYDFGKQRARVSHHDLRDALDATLNHKPAKAASGPPFGCVIETSSKP